MVELAPEHEQTEFNAAIARLMRIDSIKKGLIIATVQNDHTLQVRLLKSFLKELISVMNKDDDKKMKNRMNEIERNYTRLANAKTRGLKSVPYEIIKSFDDYEIELNNIEQKYGLSMPKKSDARWALTGR